MVSPIPPDAPVQAIVSRQRLIPGRIPVVDGLRGFAILSVLIFHVKVFAIKPGNSRWEVIYAGLAGLGWAGVDLFFVLSGFLITGILLQSLNHEHYYRNFYFRRTVRIFPLYYASLAFFFGFGPPLLTLMHHGDDVPNLIQPSSQLFAWFYILNWLMGLFSFSSVSLFIEHFWSLSIEEQFYLVWPFVVGRLNRGQLMIACLALVALSLMLRIIFYRLKMDEAAYVLTFCRLDALAVGGMVALSSRDRHWWRIASRAAPWLTIFALSALIILVGATGSVFYKGLWMGTIGISLWALSFGGLLVMVLGAPEGNALHRASSCPVLRFFGKYSYCLYICHQPLIVVLAFLGINSGNLAGIFGSTLLAVATVNGIVFLLAILVALVSWHLLEKHFLKLKERFAAGN